MKPQNRDLLVLSKKVSNNKKELELEVEKLNKILLHAESLANFCVVNEIIDLNIYKVITHPAKIHKIVKQPKMKPFQFINNKN
jgi:predicted nucleotidyltransferase